MNKQKYRSPVLQIDGYLQLILILIRFVDSLRGDLRLPC